MKKITIRIDKNDSIENAIRQLEKYKIRLTDNCEKFVKKLAQKGIKVGMASTGQYSGYILFGKDIKSTNSGASAIVYAKKKKDIIAKWVTQEGIKTANVDPLLMAEFGSGWFANSMWELGELVGQGSFPNQTHAFDPQGWFWEDMQGIKHHSKGEQPTYPVFKAWLEMVNEIDNTAKEVFK